MSEKYGTVSNSEFDNYSRVQMLLHKSSEILRHLFVMKWNSTAGKTKWEDTDTNRKDFVGGPGKSLYDQSKQIEKDRLSSNNITEWDIALLIKAAKCLNVNARFQIYEDLKNIRNELYHFGEPKVSDDQYNKYWKEISALLLQLGIKQEEIDKVKSMPLEKNDQSPKKLNLKINELRELGNKAFKEGRFEAAIGFYTEAISNPGLSKKSLAELFANRSIAFLKTGNISSAKQDAKASTDQCPKWWKGYLRLGMAYKADKKYEWALQNLMYAQELTDKCREISDQINLCKDLLGEENRQDHLDPMNFAKTLEDLAQRRPNTTSNDLRIAHNFGKRFNGETGMCTQAHDYLYGRDVQQDYAEAAKWFSKAAERGNAEGMYNLALMMTKGQGVELNFTKAIQLLERAASQPKFSRDSSGELSRRLGLNIPNIGVREAQHTLGRFYEQGIGVPQDYETAIYWYTSAIENCCGESANNIGCLYINGKKECKSTDLAFQYFKLGAALGTVRCMENLSRNYHLLGDYENMQKWYLYAEQHGSIALKLGNSSVISKYFFQDSVTQNFNKEEFTTSLWNEIKNGPLYHLIDQEVKYALDYMKIKKEFLPKQTTKYKINSSSPEAYRISITINHRKIFKEFYRRGITYSCWGNKANLVQKPVVDLFNLKEISLNELKEKNIDRIYEGFVLMNLTITEDPVDKTSESAPTPAINSVVRDEQASYQRLFVYNYYPSKEDLQKTLGFGSKISIINPYYRITEDGSPAIRVDDFNTVIVDHNLKNEKICRYCGDENLTTYRVPCGTCKRCFYCSKKCLKRDQLELEHRLVCKKKV